MIPARARRVISRIATICLGMMQLSYCLCIAVMGLSILYIIATNHLTFLTYSGLIGFLVLLAIMFIFTLRTSLEEITGHYHRAPQRLRSPTAKFRRKEHERPRQAQRTDGNDEP